MVVFSQEFGNLSLSDFDDFLEGRSKLAFNRYSLEYLYKHLPPLRIGLPHASDASRQFYLVIPSQVCVGGLLLAWGGGLL